jgi:hypothetical protein
MLNSFFSVIPDAYWLDNHKKKKLIGTLLQESEPMRSWKYFILFLERDTTPN